MLTILFVNIFVANKILFNSIHCYNYSTKFQERSQMAKRALRIRRHANHVFYADNKNNVSGVLATLYNDQSQV